MAERVWVGTDSGNEGDWSVAANWTTTTVPIDGDDVFLGPGGNQAVTAGLAQSAVSLNSLSYTSEWGSSVCGSADNYLQINADTVVLNATGQLYLDLGTTSTLATIKVNNTAANRASTHIKGNAVMLLVTKGKLTYDSGTITDIYAQYATSTSGDVDILLSTPTVTSAYVLAGLLEMNAAGTITTVHIGAGGRGKVSEGTLTNAKIWGGTLEWMTNETLARADVYGGMLDATGDQRAKTLTALYLWSAGQANLAHGAGRITLTNGYEYGLHGIRTDP